MRLDLRRCWAVCERDPGALCGCIRVRCDPPPQAHAERFDPFQVGRVAPALASERAPHGPAGGALEPPPRLGRDLGECAEALRGNLPASVLQCEAQALECAEHRVQRARARHRLERGASERFCLCLAPAHGRRDGSCFLVVVSIGDPRADLREHHVGDLAPRPRLVRPDLGLRTDRLDRRAHLLARTFEPHPGKRRSGAAHRSDLADRPCPLADCVRERSRLGCVHPCTSPRRRALDARSCPCRRALARGASTSACLLLGAGAQPNTDASHSPIPITHSGAIANAIARAPDGCCPAQDLPLHLACSARRAPRVPGAGTSAPTPPCVLPPASLRAPRCMRGARGQRRRLDRERHRERGEPLARGAALARPNPFGGAIRHTPAARCINRA